MIRLRTLAQERLRTDMARAKAAIHKAHGSVDARPIKHTRITGKCFWQFLIRTPIPRPTRDELLTYQSLQQWLAGVHRYGDDKNFERMVQGQPTLSPVYAAAGHEVRPWLAQVGSHGLLHVIELMNEGADFEAAYSPPAQQP
jgi:hypothetical protein